MIEKQTSNSSTAVRVALTGAAAANPESSDARRSSPLILPPAKVDQALAAEAARVKRSVAAARGEAIDDPSVDVAAAPVDTRRDPSTLRRIGATDKTSDDALAADRSVADVAAGVIAAMRSVEEAHERHLEAIELEAARRCELLTAQAELDAELIRINARREAHAVISAAQLQVGAHLSPVESDQLIAIGETFSRFAESIEATIAPRAAPPY